MWIGLHRQGVEVNVMTQGDTLFAQKFKEEGINIIDHYPGKKVDTKSIKLIKQLLEDEKYDILHLIRGHGLSNGVLASRGLPTKVITYIGSTSLYWHDPTSYISQLSPRVDKIHCLSYDVEQHVKNQLFINKDKTFTIHKGYNPEWFSNVKPANLSHLNLPEDAIVISCLAHVRRVKGIPYLIEAMRFLQSEKNIHLLLLGENTDSPEIMELIENSPMKDNIHIFGDRDDAINYLAASDIYVQPSIREGLGRAIMEAMSLEKPIIITDAGGCTELIENEKSGLIVPVKNAKAIAGAIERLIHNKDLRNKLKRNARLRITTQFNANITVDKMYSFYKELIQK